MTTRSRGEHFVGVSEKSLLRLAIVASGPAGHGSIPQRDSAVGSVPFTLSSGEYDRVHGNDERVSVDNVRQGIRVHYELVHGLVAPVAP